ncbi:MAG: hypothetical protein KGV51_01085 [Moraxellaceae bacterium]|nr:hypothetical protein [Moraxellaceae bacterium]
MSINNEVKKPDSKKRQLITWRFWLLLILLPCVYSASLLFFVYTNVWNSGLKGGSNGYADAYRHSLASALVAHTLSPKAVIFVTEIMENQGADDASHIMDRHNNRLGAKIGASIPLSWGSVEQVNQVIRNKVDNGKINTTDPNQIRIMPKNYWRDNRYY